MSLCVFWLRKGYHLSTYATGTQLVEMWGSSKMRIAAHMGRGSRFMCTYALTLYLFMFLAAFWPYSVLFYLQKLNLLFIQKRCVQQQDQ